MARSRSIHRKRFYLIAVGGLIVTAAFVLIPSQKSELKTAPTTSRQSTPSSTLAATAPTAINHGLPVRLDIPKLTISAKIEYLGLTKGGEMAVPSNIHDVGWYKFGALPGTKGSAVLAGHLNGLKGESGVFANLDKLQKGDIFSVTDTNNQTTQFVVREIRTYGQHEQPYEVFKSTDGVHLNLITCTGVWDREQRHFTERLVVFGDQVI